MVRNSANMGLPLHHSPFKYYAFVCDMVQTRDMRLTRISRGALLSLDQGPKGLGPNVMVYLRLQVLKVL